MIDQRRFYATRPLAHLLFLKNNKQMFYWKKIWQRLNRKVEFASRPLEKAEKISERGLIDIFSPGYFLLPGIIEYIHNGRRRKIKYSAIFRNLISDLIFVFDNSRKVYIILMIYVVIGVLVAILIFVILFSVLYD